MAVGSSLIAGRLFGRQRLRVQLLPPVVAGAYMPRFFFHIQTDSRFTDDEGVECINAVAARKAAIATCGELMRDCAETFWASRPWGVTVTDDTGLILWEVMMDGVASAAAPQ